MQLITLFPSYIYKQKLNIRNIKQFNKDLITECYQLREMDHEGRKWSAEKYIGGYTSYSSYANLNEWASTFTFLEQKITPHVHKYLSKMDYDLKGKEIFLSNIWVNIMGHGTSHSFHIHPQSVVSGTYYVQIPKGGVGIKFEDPRLDMMMAALPRKYNAKKLHQNHISVDPVPGELVLFESWMRHEVPANPTKEDRISVSFNYGSK